MVWQIFLFGNKEWILNEIKRAENYGSVAIALCLDAPIRSHRFKDRESRYDARKYGKMRRLSQNPSYALRYDWSIIKWIKSKTKKPIILKGIINLHDAYKAKKYKISTLWISNHGGRMFNSGISSGEALKFIRSKIGKKITIIVDGGVTKGTDIIKYLCLGANFVGIGKPAIYGLTIDGHKGVKQIFDILTSELKTASLNGGFKNLKDFNLKEFHLNNEKTKNNLYYSARGGSKGIKLKNLRSLNGKPLIYYPIKAALNSKACDKVIVSTDHKKIAKVSKKYGAEVPFLRQKKYSKDLVTTETTLKKCS